MSAQAENTPPSSHKSATSSLTPALTDPGQEPVRTLVPGLVIDSPKKLPEVGSAHEPIEAEDDYRHWSAKSQPFASAEVLSQYFREGWTLHDRIIVEVFRCPSRQRAELYSFMLVRDTDYIVVPVVANPLVLHLLEEFSLVVIRVYIDCDDNCR